MTRQTESFLLGYLLVTVLVVGACAGLLFGCRTTSPTPPAGEAGTTAGLVVNCGAKAVAENWARAYPAVMHCLVAILDSPMTCLDSIPAAVQVGVDTVACIVRGTSKEAAMAAEYNPEDVVTMRKAERGRAWLDSRGFKFSE